MTSREHVLIIVGIVRRALHDESQRAADQVLTYLANQDIVLCRAYENEHGTTEEAPLLRGRKVKPTPTQAALPFEPS